MQRPGESEPLAPTVGRGYRWTCGVVRTDVSAHGGARLPRSLAVARRSHYD